MIFPRPGVEVSQSMDSLIEKSLEAKSNELFAKILEIIDTIQQETKSDSNSVLAPLDSLVPPSSSEATTKIARPSTNNPSSTFELPLDLLALPGLLPSNTVTKRDILKKSVKHKSKDSKSQHDKDSSRAIESGKSVKSEIKKTTLKIDTTKDAVSSKKAEISKYEKNDTGSAKDDMKQIKESMKSAQPPESIVMEKEEISPPLDETQSDISNEASETIIVKEQIEVEEEDEAIIDDAEVFDDNISVTSGSKHASPVPPARTVRRSVRLASQEGKCDMASETSLPRTRKRTRKEKSITPLQPSEETGNMDDTHKRSSRKHPKAERSRASKPPKKKRAVVSSSSSEEETNIEDAEMAAIAQSPTPSPAATSRRSFSKRLSIPCRRLSSSSMPSVLTRSAQRRLSDEQQMEEGDTESAEVLEKQKRLKKK